MCIRLSGSCGLLRSNHLSLAAGQAREYATGQGFRGLLIIQDAQGGDGRALWIPGLGET
jgi:hypothetical protein